MFKYTNLISKYNNYSCSLYPFNKLEILNIAKYDIHPKFNNYIKYEKPINILIDSGKVLINLKKEIKKSKSKSTNNSKFISKILFAKPNLLCESNVNANDILTKYKSNYNINNEYCNYNDFVTVLTNNNKYILTILPNIYFSFYSHENNTSLMVMSNE